MSEEVRQRVALVRRVIKEFQNSKTKNVRKKTGFTIPSQFAFYGVEELLDFIQTGNWNLVQNESIQLELREQMKKTKYLTGDRQCLTT